ncbi:MAG: DUF2783 domain-containing protein [Xanthobacteraceae bacterium]|jgi:hypothetical protein|nr:DUF2783 domain-containing protein [Xanthobacteraceae bacterium]
MTMLKTEPSFPNPDAAYEMLVEGHRGVSEAESAALNARLVLILSNHIGDLAVLKEAITLAKKAG